MKKLFFILLLGLFFVSCKSIITNHKIKTATTTALELGNIGLPDKSILDCQFRTTGIPRIQNKVRIDAKIIDFNIKKFNTYSKASPENKLGIVFIDSLENKPNFVELKIIDRIGLITEINNDIETLNYLKSAKENIKVITSLSVAFRDNDLSTINNANSLFLIYDNDLKKHQILVITKDQGKTIINFNDGISFSYSISSFCWYETDKKQIKIADIIDSGESCPTKTYKKSSRAKKEVNYFKL